MIRVLHYGMSPNLGGIETYLRDLVTALDRADVQSDFLYSDSGRLPVFAPELHPLGSHFYGVTPRRANPLRNHRDLAALFREERFDILHFHANTVSYVTPVRIALRQGVRVVVHSHNAGASRSRLTRWLHAHHRRTLPWDRIARVAVSHEAGQWMFGSLECDVIPNGIDVDAFAFDPTRRDDLRSAWGVNQDTLVLGQVGAFLPAKNHAFTLDVFAAVLKLRPDALLVLVGDGPEEESTRHRAKALGLGERVRFLGRRSDVSDVMAALDILMMPSLHEGFGLVVLEAQASGLPCLVSTAVPAGVVVRADCERLSLGDSPSKWADRAASLRSGDRSQAVATVRASGFSVASNASAVQHIYNDVVRGG